MSNDPFSKHAQGYATGVPTPGAGGMPDPYSMAGVQDREARERREREARATAQTSMAHGSGPEMVILTYPHRVPKPFVKDQLIHYQLSCFQNYGKLAELKVRHKAEASKAEKSGYSPDDQEILNSKEYQEYVEKGLDLADGVYYAPRRHEAGDAVIYSPLVKPLKVIEYSYATDAIGDPSDYQSYLDAFAAFHKKVHEFKSQQVGDVGYYADRFDKIQKIHREISYIDHIEIRKKISLEKFRKFMAEMEPKDKKARRMKKLRNFIMIGLVIMFVAPLMLNLIG